MYGETEETKLLSRRRKTRICFAQDQPHSQLLCLVYRQNGIVCAPVLVWSLRAQDHNYHNYLTRYIDSYFSV